jgi:hypothetical protein
VDDPRLDCAIMRPMESDGDHFLSYYLTKDDDVALEFKKSRDDPTPDEDLVRSNYRSHTIETNRIAVDAVPLCTRLRDGKSRTGSSERVPPGARHRCRQRGRRVAFLHSARKGCLLQKHREEDASQEKTRKRKHPSQSPFPI